MRILKLFQIMWVYIVGRARLPDQYFKARVMVAFVPQIIVKLRPRATADDARTELFEGNLDLVALLDGVGVGEVCHVDATRLRARENVVLLVIGEPPAGLVVELAGYIGPGLRASAGAGHAGREFRVGELGDLAAPGVWIGLLCLCVARGRLP